MIPHQVEGTQTHRHTQGDVVLLKKGHRKLDMWPWLEEKHHGTGTYYPDKLGCKDRGGLYSSTVS